MKTVSVIMPVYNKGNHVKKAVESVLCQTFTDFELIIIDDGSTDQSPAICDHFAQIDSRICVKHILNGGVSHARNVALDLAEGEYISFIDADDYIDSSYLESLVNAMQSSNADLVISGFRKIYEKQSKILCFIPPYSGLRLFDEVIADFAEVQLQRALYSVICSKLFKRRIIEKYHARFDESIKLAEDLAFNATIYGKISTIYFLQETYYSYILDADNRSLELDSYTIDYYTQLMIWLKVTSFLEKRNAFKGNNEALVKQRIADYVIFTLFFHRFNNYASYRELFEELRKPDIRNYMKPKKLPMIFSVLHQCYLRNHALTSWVYIKLYRALRRIKHRRII